MKSQKWDNVFLFNRLKGMDPSDAAYRADEWEKRMLQRGGSEVSKKAVKFPKTVGDTVDALYGLKLEKAVANDVVKQCAEQETALRLHAMEIFGKEKLEGARGKLASCNIVPFTTPNVENWDALFSWIVDPVKGCLRPTAASKKAVEEIKTRLIIFQRRISPEAWKEFTEAKVPVLGTVAFHGTKLSLNKIGAAKRAKA